MNYIKTTILISSLVLIQSVAYAQNITLLNTYMGYTKTKIKLNPVQSNEESTIGWKLLLENKIPVAEERFKKAYQLNQKNMYAVWGMAVIYLNKDDFDSALKMLDEAYIVLNKDESFLVDYSKALSIIAIQKKDEFLLNKVMGIFEQNYQANKENTYNLQNWAIALMLSGNSKKAELLVEEAKKTKNANILDKNFLDELQKFKN